MSRWLDLAHKADEDFFEDEPQCENCENFENRGGMSQLPQFSQFSHQGLELKKHENDPQSRTETNASEPFGVAAIGHGRNGAAVDVNADPLSDVQRGAVVGPDERLEQHDGQHARDPIDAQIQRWRQCLSEMARPTTPRIAEAVGGCISVLDETWLRDAVALGWSEGELFGVDPGAPEMTARNGLVTGLFLTALKKPLRVVGINDVQAIIETGSGSKITHRARILNKGAVIWAG